MADQSRLLDVWWVLKLCLEPAWICQESLPASLTLLSSACAGAAASAGFPGPSFFSHWFLNVHNWYNFTFIYMYKHTHIYIYMYIIYICMVYCFYQLLGFDWIWSLHAAYWSMGAGDHMPTGFGKTAIADAAPPQARPWNWFWRSHVNKKPDLYFLKSVALWKAANYHQDMLLVCGMHCWRLRKLKWVAGGQPPEFLAILHSCHFDFRTLPWPWPLWPLISWNALAWGEQQLVDAIFDTGPEFNSVDLFLLPFTSTQELNKDLLQKGNHLSEPPKQ